jgi:hypothetical protein
VATTTEQADRLLCSFCGKNKDQVEKLIAGPAVYICDQCVALCDDIIAEESQRAIKEWDEFSDDDLLGEMLRVHESHHQVDAAVAAIVRTLRARSISWTRIGEALGMTRQAAWERFSGED